MLFHITTFFYNHKCKKSEKWRIYQLRPLSRNAFYREKKEGEKESGRRNEKK